MAWQAVGFDRLFDLLDKNIRSDWPPYNIERKSEDQYRITMTIAGFGPEEIELVQHGSTLLVNGQKGDQPELLHHGIPLSFKQSFNLADYVKVAANVGSSRSQFDNVTTPVEPMLRDVLSETFGGLPVDIRLEVRARDLCPRDDRDHSSGKRGGHQRR
jgi:hypothetical protein